MKPDLAGYMDHFRSRVLQDALAEATAGYWLRRAETFAAVGNKRCDEIAQACRNRAAVALVDDTRSEVSKHSGRRREPAHSHGH